MHVGPGTPLWLCNACNVLLACGVWRESRLMVASQLLAVFLEDSAGGIDVVGWAGAG